MERVHVKTKEQGDVESSNESAPKTNQAHSKGVGDRIEPTGENFKDQSRKPEELKKSQLIEKWKEAQEAADKNYDLYLRSQAEMENLKRRFQRDKEDLVKFSNESLIKELLPIIDNLEQAIAHAGNEQASKALQEGVKLTLKSLKDQLRKAGLDEVESLGRPFDPNVHEAFGVMEDEEAEPDTVLQEVQKGYMLNKRLIRPARVIVNKASS